MRRNVQNPKSETLLPVKPVEYISQRESRHEIGEWQQLFYQIDKCPEPARFAAKTLIENVGRKRRPDKIKPFA